MIDDVIHHVPGYAHFETEIYCFSFTTTKDYRLVEWRGGRWGR
jgi:hypothetical protein